MSNMQKGRLRQVLRRPAVERATGLSRSSIYEGMTAGWFPRCFRLCDGGYAVGWWEDEIVDYQAARDAERAALVLARSGESR